MTGNTVDLTNNNLFVKLKNISAIILAWSSHTNNKTVLTMTNSNTLTISIHLIGRDLSADIDLKRTKLFSKLSQVCSLANEHLHNTPIWGSGGDGVVFVVKECNDADDCDDDYDAWQNNLREKLEGPKMKDESIPHLRSVYGYGNDINEAWRVVSYMLELSTILTLKSLHVAIECLDQDGQLLLIEAAENLPEWVDEDVSQGGVGGPMGCVNRCWIVDGAVRLIPPTSNNDDGQLNVHLERGEALEMLGVCINSDEFVLDAIQNSIEARIDRTDYTLPERNQCINVKEECDVSKRDSHYHTTAAALPASVAHFVQNHLYLVPFLVDSFCNRAPQYLYTNNATSSKNYNGCNQQSVNETSYLSDEATKNALNRESHDQNSQQSNNTNTNTNTKQSVSKAELGHDNFKYEQIVLIPITMTRTTYAELITGRGVVPSFPTPKEYRSVELNRFQRHIFQKPGEQRVWRRAVDVGVRLCAGLDWILNSYTFGNSFIEDEHQEACPYTRPGVSSKVMYQSGMRNALSWVREKFCDASFPHLREWEVDDDMWMEVKSLDDLEDEMRKLSSTKVQPTKRSRRITRRSRRGLAPHESQSLGNADETAVGIDRPSQDVQALHNMMNGFKGFIEGEGDLGGAVTHKPAHTSPMTTMVEEVNINPRLFLDILQSKLLDSKSAPETMPNGGQDVSISKFFFRQDLEEESDSDESIANDTSESREGLGTHLEDSAEFEMISNLLQSLEGEGGNSGPVTNILREMGISIPRLERE